MGATMKILHEDVIMKLICLEKNDCVSGKRSVGCGTGQEESIEDIAEW